jgi:NitT/TauT family transport system ATP-binding protein
MGAVIRIKDLTKTYRTSRDGHEVRALDEITLEVGDGEFVSLVGPSGCGKSTLLSILAGLVEPTEGSTYVGEERITGPSWRRGMAFQDFALFPWLTVSENIAFGLRMRGVPRAEREAVVRKYIEIVNLGGFESRYPHELSGGMKQRVAIARTLANEPDVLLMDEPFASVDAQTRTILQDELLRIWSSGERKRTVLFVTHSVEEALYLSDRVVVLSARPGRILEEVPVPFGRPRDEGVLRDPRFMDLRLGIWAHLKHEVPR